jgi:hypothetical protein
MGATGQLPHTTVLPGGRSHLNPLSRLGGFKPGLVALWEVKNLSFFTGTEKRSLCFSPIARSLDVMTTTTTMIMIMIMVVVIK